MSKPEDASVEVTSGQLHRRLVRIEDRLAGVEAILAHANRAEIEGLIAKAVGKSKQKATILRLCETPQSIKTLQKALGFKSPQNVNNHVAPLRDHGLLEHASSVPPVTYEWSPIIRRLNKAARESLLG